MVLVGNSLVFFKDPKSQTPSSWVRAQTDSLIKDFRKLILLLVIVS